MKLPPWAAIAISSTLAACGGGGGGGLGTGTPSDVLSIVPSLASGPGDTSLDAIDTVGLTGVISQADLGLSSSSARLRSFKVLLAPDGNSIVLTVDGTSQTLPVQTKVPGGGQFGTPGSNLVQVTATSDTTALVTYSGSTGLTSWAAFGYVGIETPSDQLPTAPVTYDGFWGGQVYDAGGVISLAGGVASGNMSITVDFDDNAVSGSFSGDVNDGTTDSGGFPVTKPLAGVITGTVVDNGVGGGMTLTSGLYSGSMSYAGNAYGYGAESFAGGYAGRITETGGSQTWAITGTFDLD